MPQLSSSVISAVEGGQGRNFEPYRTYNNELTIIDLPGAETLTLSVETGVLPTIGSEPIQLGYGNDFIYLQGKTNVEPLSFTFRSFADPNTVSVLKLWHLDHYNPETGKQGLASDYKKSGLVTQILPNGTVSQIWTLHGIWIQQAEFGQIDNNSSDIQRINVTFQVDRAFIPGGFAL